MPFRALFAAALMFCGLLIAPPAWADEPAQDPAADAAVPEPGRPAEKVGWLRPNNTHRSVDAPYAIVDNSGRVRCFVRPGEGVNLADYSHHKVRVRGQTLTPAGDINPIVEVLEINPPNVAAAAREAAGRRTVNAGQQGVQLVQYQQMTPRPVAEELPGMSPRAEADALGPMSGTAVPGNMNPGNGGPGMMGGGPADSMWADGYQADSWGRPYGAQALGGTPCGCGQPSCGTCGSCNSCCQRCCGPPGMTWVRAEYLFWSTQGMNVPPLVTTGPNASNPGYLDTLGTTILYGGNQIDGYGRSGVRLTVGTWLNPCQTVGIEGDFFQLATATSNYNASGSGTDILSRPFFDTRPSLSNQNVEQVAFPNSVEGSVAVNAYTTFLGAGVRGRFNICCSQGCFGNQCMPSMNGPGGYRVDFLLGYRYLRLGDGVTVTENLTSLQTGLPGTFYIVDSFKTTNQFNGIDFGALAQVYRGRWGLEFIYRLALGNTNQLVNISGSTTTTQNGSSTTVPGGLLTQTTNIGQYDRNVFGVVPELDANLTYALTPRLRLVLGYTFIYWNNVARAGSQINTNVNSTLLPNSPNPPAGDLNQPAFAYNSSTFWAQGISAGVDYRW